MHMLVFDLVEQLDANTGCQQCLSEYADLGGGKQDWVWLKPHISETR